MSDVGLTAVADTQTNRTSSTGSGQRQVPAAETGKTLPQKVAAQAEALQEARQGVTDAGVSQAVAELNNYIQNGQRDLVFNVDEDTGSVVVKVVDRHSGELIRQIPNEVVLDLAAKARNKEPVQLISMHG